jgi:hypothetical protein
MSLLRHWPSQRHAEGQKHFNAKSQSPKDAKRILTNKTRSPDAERPAAIENCFLPLRLRVFASLR